MENTMLPLHARALDVLEFLIDHRERVVSRDEILATVWRGRIVGENNLTVQLSAVRRLLAAHDGADLIVTVVGRGYRFAGDATEYQKAHAHAASVDVQSSKHAILAGPPFLRRKPHPAACRPAVTGYAGTPVNARTAPDMEWT